MINITSLEYTRGQKKLLYIEQLELNAARHYVVVGPNGAGKSTFLKALSGDIETTGSIEFHGKALNKWTAIERARHIAVLPQHSELTFSFTSREVVSLGLIPLASRQAESQRLVENAMRQTDCLALADRPYPLLSGGQKQRVQLARVLLQLSQAEMPALLLLDEPTSAQDLGQQHSILSLIRSLARERQFCVISILHDINLALRYSDECLLLSQGRLALKGRPKEILTDSRVETFWSYRPTYYRPAVCLSSDEQSLDIIALI